MEALKVSSISIRVAGVSELLERFRGFTSQADQLIQEKMVDSVTENIVTVAKSLAPKRTGALQESIVAMAGDDPMSVLLIAGKPYSRFLEYGTRPHTIEAKNTKALAFRSGGQTVFAKRVHHPGIPEGKFSFLRPAIEIGKEKVVGDIAQMIVEKLQ